MIKGVGTDIIEIGRVVKALTRPSFVRRCFTEAELAAIAERGEKTAAGFFAAKEAVAKARGSGFNGISPKQIEIRSRPTGQPFAVIDGREDADIHISISHCGEYAAAFAVIEQMPSNKL